MKRRKRKTEINGTSFCQSPVLIMTTADKNMAGNFWGRERKKTKTRWLTNKEEVWTVSELTGNVYEASWRLEKKYEPQKKKKRNRNWRKIFCKDNSNNCRSNGNKNDSFSLTTAIFVAWQMLLHILLRCLFLIILLRRRQEAMAARKNVKKIIRMRKWQK